MRVGYPIGRDRDGVLTEYIYVIWQQYGGVHGYPISLEELRHEKELADDEPYHFQPPS